MSEPDLESDITEFLQNNPGLHLFTSSGQNIDRILSLYKACLNCKPARTLVIDLYTALILDTIGIDRPTIPRPQNNCDMIRIVLFGCHEEIMKKRGFFEQLKQYWGNRIFAD